MTDRPGVSGYETKWCPVCTGREWLPDMVPPT